MRKIFIGSSSEAVDVANAVQLALQNRGKDYFAIVWNQNTVKPSEYTIPSLVNEIKQCQYAVFIFGDDDIMRSRGKEKVSARDNVIFECGLAVGLLGLENCFVLKEENTEVPSDFRGLTHVQYSHEKFKLDRRAEIGRAVTTLEFSMDKLKKSDDKTKTISWEKYCVDVEKLWNKIKKSPRQGGFRFDIIIGISRGGIIAADLLNRKCLAESPLTCLWGDYYTNQPDIAFDTDRADINQYILEALKSDKYKSILLVDDITRAGRTVVAATDMLKRAYPEKSIKSAVLYVPDKYKSRVNYYAEIIKDKQIAMPYSTLD